MSLAVEGDGSGNIGKALMYPFANIRSSHDVTQFKAAAGSRHTGAGVFGFEIWLCPIWESNEFLDFFVPCFLFGEDYIHKSSAALSSVP